MPKSAQNRRKFLVKMATITTEYGKLSSNKTRTVYLRIRSGKTEKRINTQVKVLESEISPRTKKIKDFSKARQIEMMRLDWETKINQLGIEALGVKVDAQDITSAISKKEEEIDKQLTANLGNEWLRDAVIPNGRLYYDLRVEKTRKIIEEANNELIRSNTYNHANLLSAMEFGVLKYMFQQVNLCPPTVNCPQK